MPRIRKLLLDKREMSYAALVAGGLIIMAYFVYWSTSPEKLERKELYGKLEEASSAVHEIKTVIEAHSKMMLTEKFYNTHIDYLQDQIIDIESKVASSDFETNIHVPKEEVLPVLEEAEREIVAINGELTDQAAENRKLDTISGELDNIKKRL